MNHTRRLVLFLLFSITAVQTTVGQVSSDYSVLTTANYAVSPPSLTIHWNTYPDATSYSIFRKDKEATIWSSVASLDGSATEYTDTDIIAGQAFEYRVHRVSASGIIGEGYIYAGLELPVQDFKGKCLIILDTLSISSLDTDIQQLIQDVSGDGWAVELLTVARNNSVDSVKELVLAASADTSLSTIFLLGHVPVPYSGNLNPDGHADHQGAWPCDAFYGDLDGLYTDETVDNSVAGRDANKNIPGDGKFDQTYFPGKIELQTGRVDLYDLPSFSSDEISLLKQYLKRDHDFRTGSINTMQKGIIDDNFGAFGGEAFASDGWRNLSPMLGESNVAEADYFPALQTESDLWSYGCGGGWYQGAGGVGSVSDFAADTVKGVFTMLFGSYFGDWDNTDNFLRAPLAANGNTLACVWAGRPYWQFHHMALGENIGYSARLSQNNSSVYSFNYCAKCVHIALMGDPTLTLYPVKPVSNVEADSAGENLVQISWTASADIVEGYYVYRCDTEFGHYLRLTPDIIAAETFTDISPLDGVNYYMVRAVKLQQTASGSFYNLSTGLKNSTSIVLTDINELAQQHILLYPNPSSSIIYIELPFLDPDIALCIYDLSGHLVQRHLPAQTSFELDLSALQPGIFSVVYGGSWQKLIIVR